jgi:hypothetical protein
MGARLAQHLIQMTAGLVDFHCDNLFERLPIATRNLKLMANCRIVIILLSLSPITDTESSFSF